MHKATIYSRDCKADYEEENLNPKELRSAKSGVLTPYFLSEMR